MGKGGEETTGNPPPHAECPKSSLPGKHMQKSGGDWEGGKGGERDESTYPAIIILLHFMHGNQQTGLVWHLASRKIQLLSSLVLEEWAFWEPLTWHGLAISLGQWESGICKWEDGDAGGNGHMHQPAGGEQDDRWKAGQSRGRANP
ncbi:unnamed protein product, partial [Clonostachys solani]